MNSDTPAGAPGMEKAPTAFAPAERAFAEYFQQNGASVAGVERQHGGN